MRKRIKMLPLTGEFAENKDTAKKIRETVLLPSLERGGEVEFDFSGVSGVTQSFVHALLSEAIRRHGEVGMALMVYSNCNTQIQTIIEVVYEYMQESLDFES